MHAVAATLTIAIPTHNRARSLSHTLASVVRLRLPSDVDVQCLVIDNNSTDETPSVIDAARKTSPFEMRRVFEPRVGSSPARNRAVDEARSDFIFFLDDDAVADPGWAAEMMAGMVERRLDAACGAVLPSWPPIKRPRWLGPRLYSRLAVHDDHVLASAPLAELEHLGGYFSANVGFRRSTFDRFGRFREDLGVVGNNPMSGEDTELFSRIITGGGTMGFVRRAVVHHTLPPQRLTRSYLIRKSFAFGMGSAVAGGRSHNRLDKLLKNSLRAVMAAMRGDAEAALYHQLECANFFGYWRGRIARSGRRGKG